MTRAAAGGERNGTFMRVAVCIMAAITLISTGVAVSSSTSLFDARGTILAIDERGTKKAVALEARITVLEETVKPQLAGIQVTLKEIQQQLISLQTKGTIRSPNP